MAALVSSGAPIDPEPLMWNASSNAETLIMFWNVKFLRKSHTRMALCGLRGFRWGRIQGCHVTNFAPYRALKLIARCKLTFDERRVLHRVEPAARIARRDASEPEGVS